MAGPKIKIDTGPPKHVEETKVADVEAHTKAGPNVVKKEAVVDAAHKLPGANQLKPKTVAKTKPPKDIKNTSKKTSKKTNTTHTTNAETPKTPEAPTPNINLINPEPKTTLSVEPVKNIVNDALKIAELAIALNPHKNKNELINLKESTNNQKKKQKELTQQLRNITKENKKAREVEHEKTFITEEIAKLEGKQTKHSKSYNERLNSLTKRLLYITTTKPKAEPAVAKTDPKAPTAEPNAEPKPEPTAPKPEPTADQVVSSAPTTPKVEETKTANTASNVIKTNSAESTKTFNNYLTKRLQFPNNTKTKNTNTNNTNTKKYNTKSKEYIKLLINDPQEAEIFKEKAKAESKAELEKQVNNSISNIGKLFEETPSNSQKKTNLTNNSNAKKNNNKNSSKAIITNGAPAINILNTKKAQTHANTNTAGEYIEINNFSDLITNKTPNIQNQN